MKGTQAMDHIRDEMAATKEDSISVIGEMMTVYLMRNPEVEIAEDKTLKGAYGAMFDLAKKNRGKSNCYFMQPRMAFDTIMQYFGIKPDQAEFDACMLGMIGQSAPDTHDAAPAQSESDIDDLLDLDALLGGG